MAQANRYRSGKIKREHTITEGTLPVLKQIAELDEVTAIIPGRIAKATGGTPRTTFQYFTESGMKLSSRTITAVQEVFVVCASADGAKLAKRKLEQVGIVTGDSSGPNGGASREPSTESTSPTGDELAKGSKGSKGPTGSRGAEGAPPGTRRLPPPKRPRQPASKLRNWQDDDDEGLSHLGPRIDDETRDALRRMKRGLK